MYVTDRADWEQFLPLMLFAYHTAARTSTGISPFELMFGCSPHMSELPPLTAFDTDTYQRQLRIKLAQLQDLVDASLTQAGPQQKQAFDRNTCSFQPRDAVWLSIPTAGKLSPWWEGGWVIHLRKGPQRIPSLMDTEGKLFTLIDCTIGSNLVRLMQSNHMLECHRGNPHWSNMLRFLLVRLHHSPATLSA